MLIKIGNACMTHPSIWLPWYVWFQPECSLAELGDGKVDKDVLVLCLDHGRSLLTHFLHDLVHWQFISWYRLHTVGAMCITPYIVVTRILGMGNVPAPPLKYIILHPCWCAGCFFYPKVGKEFTKLKEQHNRLGKGSTQWFTLLCCAHVHVQYLVLQHCSC